MSSPAKGPTSKMQRIEAWEGEREVTVVAPINIALVKYWGKRDDDRMLPWNDSLGITIDALYAFTKVRVRFGGDPNVDSDAVVVNGKQMIVGGDNNRYQKCFEEIRRVVKQRLSIQQHWSCHAASETNFPTSAGLASSAAGFAALAYGLGQIFGLEPAEMSQAARLGSGSACRSVFGGFVHWHAGSKPDGSDCICEVVADRPHWPELKAIVVVTSLQAKHTGSTDGMQATVETSGLFRHRVDKCVPENIREIRDAIHNKNFPKFAEIVMRESNQLHALCLDTDPPLFYLNDASRHLIRLVTAYNKREGITSVAYTFDAGPNCCLLMTEKTLSLFLPYLCFYCPPSRDFGSEDKFILGLEGAEVGHEAKKTLPLPNFEPMPGSVQYLVVSGVGGGPYIEHK